MKGPHYGRRGKVRHPEWGPRDSVNRNLRKFFRLIHVTHSRERQDYLIPTKTTDSIDRRPFPALIGTVQRLYQLDDYSLIHTLPLQFMVSVIGGGAFCRFHATDPSG